MSSSRFLPDSNQYDDLEVITLYDEEGRSLDCFIENAIIHKGKTYLLLMPIDATIVILTEDNEADDNYSETFLLENSYDLDEVFDDAKAVLGELNLYLKRSAFTLTAHGELPLLDEGNIISLELDDDNRELSIEELQFLVSFYHEEQKYNICTPLTPILFVAQQKGYGKVEMLKGDDQELQIILEELLFDPDNDS
jgi:hypothetical protein